MKHTERTYQGLTPEECDQQPTSASDAQRILNEEYTKAKAFLKAQGGDEAFKTNNPTNGNALIEAMRALKPFKDDMDKFKPQFDDFEAKGSQSLYWIQLTAMRNSQAADAERPKGSLPTA